MLPCRPGTREKWKEKDKDINTDEQTQSLGLALKTNKKLATFKLDKIRKKTWTCVGRGDVFSYKLSPVLTPKLGRIVLFRNGFMAKLNL